MYSLPTGCQRVCMSPVCCVCVCQYSRVYSGVRACLRVHVCVCGVRRLVCVCAAHAAQCACLHVCSHARVRAGRVQCVNVYRRKHVSVLICELRVCSLAHVNACTACVCVCKRACMHASVPTQAQACIACLCLFARARRCSICECSMLCMCMCYTHCALVDTLSST